MMTSLTEEQQERLDIISHKLKFMEQKPVVACLVSLDPLTFADTDIAASISLGGGVFIGSYDADIPVLNPDVAILLLPGTGIEQAMTQIGDVLQLPNFDTTKAIKNNRLYIVDGEKYFNGDDTVAVDAVELLAEIIYPKLFIFGHEGEGWVKFSLQ